MSQSGSGSGSFNSSSKIINSGREGLGCHFNSDFIFDRYDVWMVVQRKSRYFEVGKCPIHSPISAKSSLSPLLSQVTPLTVK
jgi:hypothetical protein